MLPSVLALLALPAISQLCFHSLFSLGAMNLLL